jgi:hypothetical protein
VASSQRTRPYRLPSTMLEAAKNLFLIVSALFPIVDPLGGSPFFLAMTNEYLPCRDSALRASGSCCSETRAAMPLAAKTFTRKTPFVRHSTL